MFEKQFILAEAGNAQAQNYVGKCYAKGYGIAQNKEQAFQWFKKAADGGDVEASYNLAVCYGNGRGVAKDDMERVRWLKKAAERKHIDAQFHLAVCFKDGNGVEKDEAEAVHWFKQAAEQGDADAQFNLGICYANGKGVEKDEAEAVRWFKKVAEQGDADAQCKLGISYANGKGVEKDEAKAVYWYSKAAEKEHADAQFNLGVRYTIGRGVEKDEVKAVYWYSKAAEKEHADAQYYLGVCYANGNGVGKDEAKAVYWYTKAAEQEQANAQYNLGWCYKKGHGVEKNEAKAVSWYTKAAEQGHVGAQSSLGECYAQGCGIEKNDAKAVSWYTKAAEKEQANAQYNVGVHYAHGRGVKKDEAKAVYWYKKAAENEDAIAQCKLGVCYSQGWEVEKDEAKAVYWYTKAAEQGQVEAQFNLAWCYETGHGVGKDEAKASYWYEKAAAQGHASARDHLARLNRQSITQPAVLKPDVGSTVPNSQSSSVTTSSSLPLKTDTEHKDRGGVSTLSNALSPSSGSSLDSSSTSSNPRPLSNGSSQTMTNMPTDTHSRVEMKDLSQDPSLQASIKKLREWVDKHKAIEAAVALSNNGSSSSSLSSSSQATPETTPYKPDEKKQSGPADQVPTLQTGREIASKNPQKLPGNKAAEKNLFEQYLQLAQTGNAHAQNYVGKCYARGRGVVQNEGKAFDWFKKAANTGDAEGLYNLAVCYGNGCGVTKDEIEMARWLKEAANQGYVNAQFQLATCYSDGTGIEKDEAKAVYWFTKAAEKGEADAQYDLGLCYAKGCGVKKDEAEAVYWFTKAAEQGQADAQHNLGGRYATGRGVEKDEAKAVYWYTKAAEQGEADAQYDLGGRYATGRGVEKDEAKAVYWYTKAAEQGQVNTQHNLGWHYANGRGAEKDEAKAVYWYTKAAEKGEADAQYSLGVCYANGRGAEKDEAKAVYWYTKAAEQGQVGAQYNLGLCYAEGCGVEKDEAKGVYWYTKAAEKGQAHAQNNLGVCYERGHGVGKDEAKAVYWYTKAAAQGFASAQANLARLNRQSVMQPAVLKTNVSSTVPNSQSSSLTTSTSVSLKTDVEHKDSGDVSTLGNVPSSSSSSSSATTTNLLTDTPIESKNSSPPVVLETKEQEDGGELIRERSRQHWTLHMQAMESDLELSEKLALSKALFAELETGNISAMKSLVDKGALLTVRNDKGETPLLVAARKGYLDAVNIFLGTDEGRASVDQVDNEGQTPLIAVVMAGHLDIGAALIKSGANYRASREWFVSYLKKTLAEKEREKTNEALANLDVLHCQARGVVPAGERPATEFTEGFFINALREKVAGGQMATSRKTDVDDIVAQFWRDAGIGGGINERLKFSEQYPWLRAAIERTCAVVSSPLSTAFLYEQLYSCLNAKVKNSQLENAKKVLVINEAANTIQVSYVLTLYRRLDDQGLAKEDLGIALNSPIIITGVVTAKDILTLQVSSVVITKENAMLLGLQWYLQDCNWFSPYECVAAELRHLEEKLEIDKEDLDRLAKRTRLLDSRDEESLSAYIGDTDYLRRLVELTHFVQKFLPREQQHELLFAVHALYRSNQRLCHDIMITRKTSENIFAWLFWQNMHWHLGTPYSTKLLSEEPLGIFAFSTKLDAKSFRSFPGRQNITLLSELDQRLLSNVFSQSMEDAITQFDAIADKTAGLEEAARLHAALVEKIIAAVNPQNVSSHQSSSSSSSTTTRSAAEIFPHSTEECLGKLALQESVRLQGTFKDRAILLPLALPEKDAKETKQQSGNPFIVASPRSSSQTTTQTAITKLQRKEQAVSDQEVAEFQAALASPSPDKPERKEQKEARINLSSRLRSSSQQLDKVRGELIELQTLGAGQTAPEAKSLDDETRSLSAIQIAQIELGKRLLNIKLTQVFTKALAVKHQLVDTHNRKRVGRLIALVTAFLPIPALGLALHGAVALGEMAFSQITQKFVEDQDRGKHQRQIGEIETIDQAAELVAALVETFARRFQRIFAQLRPESLEIFVDKAVERMVDYWESIAEKVEKPEDKARWLSQGLVDFTQTLPTSSAQLSTQPNQLTRSQEFNHFVENMVIGSSLWKGRETSMPRAISQLSGDKGVAADLASFMIGDSEVTYQNARGLETALVQQICRGTSVVTWTGERHPVENKPIYRRAQLADSEGLFAEPPDMPPLYLSEAECRLRKYVIGTRVVLEMPMLPKEFTLSREQQLEQLLEAERARAERERARADAAEAQLARLQQAETAPIESKSSSRTRERPVVGMFDQSTASGVLSLTPSGEDEVIQLTKQSVPVPSTTTSSSSSSVDGQVNAPPPSSAMTVFRGRIDPKQTVPGGSSSMFAEVKMSGRPAERQAATKLVETIQTLSEFVASSEISRGVAKGDETTSKLNIQNSLLQLVQTPKYYPMLDTLLKTWLPDQEAETQDVIREAIGHVIKHRDLQGQLKPPVAMMKGVLASVLAAEPLPKQPVPVPSTTTSSSFSSVDGQVNAPPPSSAMTVFRGRIDPKQTAPGGSSSVFAEVKMSGRPVERQWATKLVETIQTLSEFVASSEISRGLAKRDEATSKLNILNSLLQLVQTPKYYPMLDTLLKTWLPDQEAETQDVIREAIGHVIKHRDLQGQLKPPVAIMKGVLASVLVAEPLPLCASSVTTQSTPGGVT
jgi:TPR repeat protein